MATPRNEQQQQQQQQLGDFTKVATASGVDIGLMAELGAAITRGSPEVRSLSLVTAEAEHGEHAARPVPLSAPETPITELSPAPVARPPTHSEAIALGAAWTPGCHELVSNAAWSGDQTSLIGRVAEYGTEMAVTSLVATAGAIGGASAGEIIRGDRAASSLGPLAMLFGQGVGSNIGRIVGGTVGAAAIRCSSRSKSVGRSTSQGRFAPDVPLRYQHISGFTAQTVETPRSTLPNDLLVALRADSAANT